MPNKLAVHCKKDKYDIYIGRPSKWGNPYVIGRDGDRREVLEKYRKKIESDISLKNALPELKGRILGCWCAPEACHGDILAELSMYRRMSPAQLEQVIKEIQQWKKNEETPSEPSTEK